MNPIDEENLGPESDLETNEENGITMTLLSCLFSFCTSFMFSIVLTVQYNPFFKTLIDYAVENSWNKFSHT